MSIDEVFFPDRTDEDPDDGEHAVMLCLKLSDDEDGSEKDHDTINELEDHLAAAIETEGVGELGQKEYGRGICTLHIYGPDADSLYDAIEETLGKFPLVDGSYAIKRYGGPGAHEVHVDL